MLIKISSGLSSLLLEKYLFLDTDILIDLFHSEDLFKIVFNLLKNGHPMVDPFVKFEFYRDSFHPEEIAKKELFLNMGLFTLVPMRHEHFNKIEPISIELSRIYTHKKLLNKPSVTDLFLGSRLILHHTQSLLITANRKDYPSEIFKLEDFFVTLSETNISPLTRIYYILSLDESCYKKSVEDLSKVG